LTDEKVEQVASLAFTANTAVCDIFTVSNLDITELTRLFKAMTNLRNPLSATQRHIDLAHERGHRGERHYWWLEKRQQRREATTIR